MHSNITLRTIIFVTSTVLFLQGCDQPAQIDTEETQATIAAKNNETSNATNNNVKVIDKAAVDRAAAQIDETDFMRHVNTLAADEFEGRAPSTPGGRKTVEYLENAFAQAGLEPAFSDSQGQPSWRQGVDLMELTVTNSPSLTFSHENGSSADLPYKEQSVVFTSRIDESAQIKDSQLVFVGYGVVAPEYGWNDYAGLDMTGKTAVILVNDPGFRRPDRELFKGRTMTYYGRWTYKFEEAAKQGAAAAIVIHEDDAAGYPWEVVSGSWSGPQYKLFTEDSSDNSKSVAVEAWITKDAATDLFTVNDMDYTKMVELATEPGFKPVTMTSTASSKLFTSSKKSKSYNVAGMIKGSQRADEAFIYTAHWDHLGVKPDAKGNDKIFNGAQDNATGTAGLIEMAEAFSALPTAPARSVVFLAVTAEESGLLGSKKYSEAPAFPMSKTVAGINIDSMSTIGASDDIVVVGYGNSQMDDYLREIAREQGREVVAEPTPEKGFFYRSDHFNLAKKGVPMLYARAGASIRGKSPEYGEKQTLVYLMERYHKAGDEVHAKWDNGGILQDLDANFRIGVKISNSNDWPQWTEGNEFKAIREASLSTQ